MQRENGRTDEVLRLVERKTASVLLTANIFQESEARLGGLAVDVRGILVDDEAAVVGLRELVLVEGEVRSEEASDLVVEEGDRDGSVGDVGFEELAEEVGRLNPVNASRSSLESVVSRSPCERRGQQGKGGKKKEEGTNSQLRRSHRS
jgi:hypothetical protein